MLLASSFSDVLSEEGAAMCDIWSPFRCPYSASSIYAFSSGIVHCPEYVATAQHTGSWYAPPFNQLSAEVAFTEFLNDKK